MFGPGITGVSYLNDYDTWYVTKNGSDVYSGRERESAFLTIAHALSVAAAGDHIQVGAGTYDEAGLDLDLAGLVMTLEPGVVLQDSADGDVLTLSAFGAAVFGQGNVRLDPTGGATGVVISGSFCYVERLRVNCNSVGAIGYDVQAAGAELILCRTSNPTTAAYKIGASTCLCRECCTGGNAATIGYWLTGSNDKARLIECGSQGHSTASFQIDTGCTNTVIWNFSSGGGDGKWTDADTQAVINGLDYERNLSSISTFTATGGVGGAGINYNIFRVYGAVRVYNIWGHVETVIPATNSTVNLELYSTNGNPDITDSAGAPDLVSRVVGTVVAKESVSTDPLEIGEPDSTPAIIENASFNDPRVPIILIEDDSAATYIQVVLSAALASGAIHWHVEWEPITDDGWVEAV